jgi:hypothetical protein
MFTYRNGKKLVLLVLSSATNCTQFGLLHARTKMQPICWINSSSLLLVSGYVLLSEEEGTDIRGRERRKGTSIELLLSWANLR